MGAPAPGIAELGGDARVPQMGDWLPAGARRVFRSRTGGARLHRGRGAQFPTRGRAGRPALLQTMDTEKLKMGWLVVAFDLPVGTKQQRKQATGFRDFLIEDGYQMIQFSVYARACVSFARQE